MGITQISWDRLNTLLGERWEVRNGLKMLELGSQNMYTNAFHGKMAFAKHVFLAQGVDHTSIDLNGDGGSERLDLGTDLADVRGGWAGHFDVVTDYGTAEHVKDLHACLANVRNFCRPGGLMFHENPKVGNWPGHGFHYFTEDFWAKLCQACGDTLVDVGEHAAMGNTTDGWNIHCVIEKGHGIRFPDRDTFSRFDLHAS